MSQPELLTRVVRALETADIPYMITGSVASSLQGEPRSTHDIDIVVAIKPSSIDDFKRVFPEPEFYLDPTTRITSYELRIIDCFIILTLVD